MGVKRPAPPGGNSGTSKPKPGGSSNPLPH